MTIRDAIEKLIRYVHRFDAKLRVRIVRRDVGNVAIGVKTVDVFDIRTSYGRAEVCIEERALDEAKWEGYAAAAIRERDEELEEARRARCDDVG